MRTAEGVVDVQVTELCQLPSELRGIGLFSGVEPQILEQQGLARFEFRGELLSQLADAVRGEGDIFRWPEHVIKQLSQTVDDGPEAQGLYPLALGPAEVRTEDHLGLVTEGVLDSRNRLADAGIISDFGAIGGQRNVEIHANQNALICKIKITNRKLGHDLFEHT